MMIFGHSLSSSVQKICATETKHSLLIKCQRQGRNHLFINFHLPTVWQDKKLVHDSLEETNIAS